jgi:murein DD-endopeptidase MepM/ murein hydrolase activator NlpD
MPINNFTGREAVGQSMTMQVADALTRTGGATSAGQESLQRAAVPFTIIPERPREEISIYAVEPGDTVLGIAEKFGLQPETIQWSNPSLELNPDLLSIGDQLKILPLNGVLHTVAPGDTLSSLAKKYRVEVADVVSHEMNNITDETASLTLGMELVIPGGTKPYVARQVAAYSGPIPANATRGSGAFVWPASGSITQRFWNGHRAIDVGSWNGSPVKAADSGYVAIAGGGWNGGYGNYVVVDHGNGYISLYAHLNSVFVRPGENVVRGQQLGTVGNTGNSTGPHLHFEIRYQGVPRNPFSFLP